MISAQPTRRSGYRWYYRLVILFVALAPVAATAEAVTPAARAALAQGDVEE